jgi:endonuclease V-like protein UPF0215 family
MTPSAAARPHLLGVDDGPFEKYAEEETAPIVGVMMEGADLVEAVAVTRFRVDGDGVSEFLSDWIEGLRFRPALQGVIFGGITIAGLAVLDPEALAARLGLPILIVNRQAPSDAPLRRALHGAGHPERIRLLERAPRPFAIEGGLHLTVAGTEPAHAVALVGRALRKSDLPEPLRLAHLFARALVTGESRGRP